LLNTIERALGVKDGGTNKDMMFSLETVACLGTCFLAPVMMVDGNYYGQVSPDRVRKILDQYE
jgi:NADH-quinone oxidoreductase subunit E